MSNKTKYSLLLLVVTVGLYFAERYVNNRVSPKIESGETTSASSLSNWFPGSTTGVIVEHNYYTLSYSEPHEQAEWVAYSLEANQVVNQDFDRPYFEQDPKIKSGSADWRNYKNSGFDRGHLCPAADREFDYNAFKETFLTSNISPQNHDFNSRIWNYLEQRVRRWAKENNHVFVITGGVLSNPLTTIGEQQIPVPNAFYKIVATEYLGEIRALGFLIPHDKNSNRYSDFMVSIDTIEQATGIDFFEQLPAQDQAEFEASVRADFWGL